jgi:hypothetical protein
MDGQAAMGDNVFVDQIEALEKSPQGTLNRVEHRAGLFTAISHDQEESGHHELAQTYKKQAVETRAYAESIRKLLMGKT